MRAQLLAAGEGETIRPFFEIKVGRPELVLTEARYEPGQEGPPPHVHHHHSDSFWVLDGRLEVRVGPGSKRVLEVEAGCFALAPPDVVHSFRNPGPGNATFLNLHMPGCGFEEYLRSGFKAPFDQHDPPPDGGRPADEAIFLGPGEGDRLDFGESWAIVKADVDDAIGSFALMDFTIAPGFPGPVLHRHEAMVDSFYVLEGTLQVTLGDETLSAGPGSYAMAPPGTAHTISNPGPDPVRMLNLIAPGGFERYLRELADLDGELDPARMSELASKYDFVDASRGLTPPEPR